MKLTIAQIASHLEQLFPRSMQESYDNSGLLVGSPQKEIESALISLDVTEAIIQEAMDRNCQLVIAHHPIIFRGIKRLTGANYVERTVEKAIKADIGIYVAHTNLDNYQHGVNAQIGRKLGIRTMKVLQPKENVLTKLVTFVPKSHSQQVLKALFASGAGSIGNYSECSFSHPGLGTFKGNSESQPFVGKAGERHMEEEERIEVVVSNHQLSRVVSALNAQHPYEEVAFDCYPLSNTHPLEGSGKIGELEEAWDEKEFLQFIKDTFQCGVIRHTPLLNRKIKKVAWCGGSGSFLIETAKRSGADIYITADVKYHEFFDADGSMLLVDIGHYESEQYTIQLLSELITKKFPKFALHLTGINTNPINYF